MKSRTFMQWVVAVIVIFAAIAIVYVALPAMGIAIPAVFVQILWIILIAFVAVAAIGLLVRHGTAGGMGRETDTLR